jgi:hypothetical protein
MDLTTQHGRIPPMTPAAIANVTALEQQILTLPQTPIRTQHVLHAGMYSRTIIIPAGIVLTGALIKIPTLLWITGDVTAWCGPGEGIRVIGVAVIPASAGRKQAFVTFKETSVTMAFPTSAKTVEQAEAEFTDDTDLLFSRRDPDLNTTIITGE